MDGRRCVVPGCPERAVIVEYIKARPPVTTPCDLDVVSNLRSRCLTHDVQQ